MGNGAENVGGIYAIHNSVSGKTYIGQAAENIARRWRQHRYRLNRGTHANPHLQNAWNKYGKEAFRYEILEVIDSKDIEYLAERETYWVEIFRSQGRLVYNVGATGPSTNLGRVFPESVRERVRQAVLRQFDATTPEGEARRRRASETRITAYNRTYRLLSPMGEVMTTRSLKRFSEEHGLDFKEIFRVYQGRRQHWHGWRNADNPGKISWNISGVFVFRSPIGERIELTNQAFKEFCVHQGLSELSMRRVHKGTLARYKGWTKGD